MKITKTVVNFWLDSFLLGVFLTLCWVSIILRYVFPTPGMSEGWKLWGLDYLTWTDIQFFTLCTLTSGILLHLMLHWTWVCGVVESWQRKRRGAEAASNHDTGSRTLWGVGLLIVICNIVGLGIAAAVLTIHRATL